MLPYSSRSFTVPVNLQSYINPMINQPAEGFIQGADYNYCYYEEYKKLYVASFMLSTQMKELLKTKDELIGKLNRLEKKTDDFVEEFKNNSNTDDRKKRTRRSAVDIPRNYRCSVEKCQKLYGTEGSLLQHIKLKHPDVYALDPHPAFSDEDGDEAEEEDEPSS